MFKIKSVDRCGDDYHVTLVTGGVSENIDHQIGFALTEVARGGNVKQNKRPTGGSEYRFVCNEASEEVVRNKIRDALNVFQF